jgi:hypothetical protein
MAVTAVAAMVVVMLCGVTARAAMTVMMVILLTMIVFLIVRHIFASVMYFLLHRQRYAQSRATGLQTSVEQAGDAGRSALAGGNAGKQALGYGGHKPTPAAVAVVTLTQGLIGFLAQGLGQLREALALVLGGEDHATVFQQPLEACLEFRLEA